MWKRGEVLKRSILVVGWWVDKLDNFLLPLAQAHERGQTAISSNIAGCRCELLGRTKMLEAVNVGVPG